MKNNITVLMLGLVLITNGVLSPNAHAADGAAAIVLAVPAALLAGIAACGALGEAESRAANYKNGAAETNSDAAKEAVFAAIPTTVLGTLAMKALFSQDGNKLMLLWGAVGGTCGIVNSLGYYHGRNTLTAQSEKVKKAEQELQKQREKMDLENAKQRAAKSA